MIGDHIRTLKAGRWTHAIDCGDETVILLADEAEKVARVRRSYRPEFVSGAETVEIVRHRERTFAAEQVVARAYSRISDPALASMFRDSEAFAEWCTTGRLPSAPPNVAISVPGVDARSAPQAPSAAPAPARATPVKARPAAGARPAAKVGPASKARPAAKARPATKARRPAARAGPAAKASGARAARGKPARKPAPEAKPAKRGKRR